MATNKDDKNYERIDSKNERAAKTSRDRNEKASSVINRKNKKGWFGARFEEP